MTDENTNDGLTALQETAFSVQSLESSLASLACPKFACFDKATPSQWGDMIHPTPLRAIWHTLTRFSTYATLASADILPSNDNL
jgi:hypothetical protein